MLVSVIIPAYNLESNISSSILSVLNQKEFDELEVIVVDDGSTDGTLSVIEELAKQDERIRVVRQKNSGVSAARNRGLDEACGKYVMFLDGDDIISPDAIKVLYDQIEGDDDYVLSGGEFTRITGYDYSFQQTIPEYERIETHTVINQILLWQCEISACAKLFNRQKIGELRFVEGKGINEDKYFLFKYLMGNNGIVIRTKQIVYGYYYRADSASNSTFNPKTLDMIYFSDAIERDVEKDYPAFAIYARSNSIVTHLAVLKKIVRSGAYKQNKTLFNQIKGRLLSIVNKDALVCIKKYKIEIAALRCGNFVYCLCVKVHDAISKRG